MMKSVVLAGVASFFLALPVYAQERKPQIPTEQMTPAQKCDLDGAAQVALAGLSMRGCAVPNSPGACSNSANISVSKHCCIIASTNSRF
jgi:hypothetical protein